MLKRTKILTLLLLLMGFSQAQAGCISSAEVTFTSIPADYQLFPRNVQDEAMVTISGSVINSQIDQICLTVYSRTEGGSNTLYQTQTCQSIGAGQYSFSFPVTILAALQEYRFEIHTYDGGNLICSEIRDWVVCGDAFALCGQSNATSAPYDANCGTYDKPYFGRSFGNWSQDDPGTYLPYNTSGESWGRANCNWQQAHWAGYMALEIMNKIQDDHGVPVAFINGSIAGQSITALKASQTPSNPSNLNLSMGNDVFFHKVYQMGLQNHLKGIIWYQGESDVANHTAYPGHFQQLYTSWIADFPNLERIYMFQLHPYGDNFSEDQSKFREMQRTLPGIFPKLTLIATCGIGEDGHTVYTSSGLDKLHYSLTGHEQLADLVYRFIERDFYCASQHINGSLTSPNLQKITKGNRVNNKVTYYMDFNQTISIDETITAWGYTRYLANSFFRGNGNVLDVINFTVNGSRLEMEVQLGALSTTPTKITYLPGGSYPGGGDPYEGPWIWNSNKTVGALSFWEVKADNARTDASITYAENVSDNWPTACIPWDNHPGTVCGQPQNYALITADVVENCQGCTGSFNEILNGREVEYRAVYKVKLKPGFHAQSGSEFRATLTEQRNCGITAYLQPEPGDFSLYQTEAVVPQIPEPETPKASVIPFRTAPNPFSETVRLIWSPDSYGETWEVNIYDLQGKPVWSNTCTSSAQDQEIHLGHLPRGYYLGTARSAATQLHFRLVRQ